MHLPHLSVYELHVYAHNKSQVDIYPVIYNFGSATIHSFRLRGYEHDVSMYKPNIDELEAIHQEVQSAMIFENRHTPYTMEVSRFKLITVTISV